eukprot:UN09504
MSVPPNTIDKNVLYLVFGYIKNQQQLLPSNQNVLYIIPELVIYLCINFYWIPKDCWHIVADGMQISGQNNETLTKIGKDDWQNTSYGKIEISSTEKCVYKWCLSIHNASYCLSIIGITADFEETNDEFWRNKTVPNYSFYTDEAVKQCKGSYTEYGQKCGGGDKISVELDLETKTISFYVNDKSQGIAYDNIETGDNIKYKLAYTTYLKEAAITITDFDIKQKQ